MSVGVIRSLEYDQSVILNGILQLAGLQHFDVDLTYGNGAFYKDVPEPLIKFDKDEGLSGCIPMCSTATGLAGGSVGSAIFDPPFLTYVRGCRPLTGRESRNMRGFFIVIF